jgi:hypothetical protein
MTIADGVHLAIAGAAGIFILIRYRYVRGESPALALLMALGILARAAVGLTLFWISYLNLPFLKQRQSGDGFWVLAPNARSYYQAAIALGDTLPQNSVTRASPTFVTALAGWMHLALEKRVVALERCGGPRHARGRVDWSSVGAYA